MACIIVVLMAGSIFTGQSWSQVNIFNGKDWMAIDGYKITSDEKQALKESAVKAAIEAAYFNSAPIATYDPDMNMRLFVDTIDKFYKTSENGIFPLYFAVRIADLVHKRTPEATINEYKAAVLDKLKKSGFLKQ